MKTMKSDTDIKLADFGFAKMVKTQNGCRTLCGTPGYLAPEILERWPAYDTKCDLWSVGVILFLLLGGYLPFEDEDEDKVFDRTRNGQYEFHPHYFGKVSNEAKELVTILLTINPSKRASADKALEHKWMKRVGSELNTKQLNADKLKATIMAKEKIRKAVNAVVVANRLNDLNEGFTQYLRRRRDDEPNFSIHPGQRRTASIADDSTSGEPFSEFYTVGDLVRPSVVPHLLWALHVRSPCENEVSNFSYFYSSGREHFQLSAEPSTKSRKQPMLSRSFS